MSLRRHWTILAGSEDTERARLHQRKLHGPRLLRLEGAGPPLRHKLLVRLRKNPPVKRVGSTSQVESLVASPLLPQWQCLGLRVQLRVRPDHPILALHGLGP